ncbi:glutamine synthetase family protein [Porticoccus sp.]
MQGQEELAAWLQANNVSEVECLVPDMTGSARGKFIPANKFLKEESRLPESILVQTVTGDFSSRFWGVYSSSDGDMILEPDLSAVRMVPWANEPTAQIIHNCYDKEGNPHPLSTRNVLKKVLALYEQEGWYPIVAPEVEFYLIERNLDPDVELKPPMGRSGRPETARQSYSIDAANEFEPFVEDMYNYCNIMELDVDTLIHESGPAQLEINFLHGDALDLADQVFTFKRTIREIALKHNIYATFMAKPMKNEPGSALHLHQSIVDSKGDNIFSAPSGDESEYFRWYIGGLQKYTYGVISLFAPNVNSYRRFTKDVSAPINLCWGYDNRTAGLRVPDCTPASRRVENRFPGADVNPYLAIAASLACGYLGIKNHIEPTSPHQGNAYEEEITLPRSLEEGIRALDECDEIKEIFGELFVMAYTDVKLEEFEAFIRVISSWEREFLLLSV